MTSLATILPGGIRAAVRPCAVWQLCLLALALPGFAHAEVSKIGRAFPIAEPDALSEIESKVVPQPATMAGRFGPMNRWQALRAAALAPAPVNRTRFSVPFHTLEEDIRLPDGRLLYAKGYTFNPLSYVTLAQRLIIVAPRDLDWALVRARPSDFILLAAGGPKDSDAITLGRKKARALFILEPRMKERLGLTVAPVIVHQVGQRLQLDEYRLPPRRAGT